MLDATTAGWRARELGRVVAGLGTLGEAGGDESCVGERRAKRHGRVKAITGAGHS